MVSESLGPGTRMVAWRAAVSQNSHSRRRCVSLIQISSWGSQLFHTELEVVGAPEEEAFEVGTSSSTASGIGDLVFSGCSSAGLY